MATIIPRKRKDGMRYTAQVRLKHHGKVIHFESETFDKKSLAKEWGRRRESELKLPGALDYMRYKGLTGQRRGSQRRGSGLALCLSHSGKSKSKT